MINLSHAALSIHSAGLTASSRPYHEGGALNLSFGEYPAPELSIFLDDAELTAKLAAAINAVIAEHSTLNRAQQGIGRAA